LNRNWSVRLKSDVAPHGGHGQFRVSSVTPRVSKQGSGIFVLGVVKKITAIFAMSIMRGREGSGQQIVIWRAVAVEIVRAPAASIKS
jgi:hypothetical protein